MIARLNPADVRPNIEEHKVRWLGRIGGFDYAEHHGIEYVVTINPVDPRSYSRQPGEVVIVKRVRELFEGTAMEHDNQHRATIVPSGTYADLAAKAAAAKARAVRKAVPRPLDALAVHSLMRRSPATVLRLREETDLSIAGIGGATRGIVIPEREQQRGPQAIIEVLRQKGVEVRLSADKSAIVPLTADGRTRDIVRELIEAAQPLLLAHLRGQPLRCQLRHSEKQPPEAESLLVGGAAACAAHLAGELAP
jgi:hypothetical protein